MGQRIPVNLRLGRLLRTTELGFLLTQKRCHRFLPFRTPSKNQDTPPTTTQAHFLWPFDSKGPAVSCRLMGVTRP